MVCLPGGAPAKACRHDGVLGSTNVTKGDIKFYKGTPDRIHVLEPEKTNEVWLYAETVEGKKIASAGKVAPLDSM